MPRTKESPSPQEAMAHMRDELCEAYDITPFDINNGFCDEWAYQVHELLKESKHTISIWATHPDEANANHYFIQIDFDKFFDAEEIQGVKDYMDLPIFARLNKTIKRRQPVWVEHYNHKELCREYYKTHPHRLGDGEFKPGELSPAKG